MASGPLLEGGVDGSREKRRWVESKVYTRKIHNKVPKPNQNQNTSSPTLTLQTPSSQQTLVTTADAIHDSSLQQQQLQLPPPPLENPRPSAPSDEDAFSLHPKPEEDNRVIVINFASKKKPEEVRELRRKLTSELELVRLFVRKIEERQLQISTKKDAFKADDVVASFPIKSVPALSETASATAPASVCHQLTVSVPATAGRDNGVVDVMEKEKRTPKANQYYTNTDFLLGKDRLPSHESNKKSKNGIKNGLQALETKINEQAFRKCEMLLSKLMKHTHGWVFNTPVDAKALGLPDYHKIITHPMDLGTVKSRLSRNWYKAPKEFAEDVRLTFHNAMTYNPKGQDVNIMAQQLLQMFEERWPVIEADLAYLYSPPSMKRPPPFHMKRTLGMSDSDANPLATVDFKPKSLNRLAHIGRTPTSKKPKAKDPNKREMTFEEKQRLSNNLQNLPSEKLDMVVEIIRKRNLSLSQHEDEIEVDIDSVDTETLWELDRFVTNYKKSLSKNRRRAELANLSKAEIVQHAQKREQRMVESAPPELLNENKTVEKTAASSLPVFSTRIGENASSTSSSSSSSSDSGSSSSDSDSESSSGSGSDRAKSPQT